MATGTQLSGRTRLTSMDELVGNDDQGEPLMLHDVLGNNQDDPGTKAARKMDWDLFLKGLSKQDIAIINCIIQGRPLAGLARRRHLNNSTMMYHRERLAQRIASFMGNDILVEIGRKPSWNDSINAAREKMAYREQHRTL